MIYILNKAKYRKEKDRLDDELHEMENKKKNLQMDLDVESKKHRIALEDATRIAKQRHEDITREAEQLHEDKVRELQRDAIEQQDDFERKMREIKEDHDRDSKNNQKEFERMLAEKEGLLKLNYEQQLAKLKHENSQATTKLKDDHNSLLSKTKDELAKKHMDDVRATFKQLNMEGTQTSKFMQDIALKMFDKMPTQLPGTTTDVNVGISDKRVTKEKEPKVVTEDGKEVDKSK
jgi:hypothetical protein